MPFKKHMIAKNIIFVILIVIILLILPQIKAIAMLFFASYVIACSLNPIVDKLAKRMDRAVSTTLVLIGTLLTSFVFFIPIVFIAIKQVNGFITILPEKVAYLQNYIFNLSIYGHKLPELVDIKSMVNTSSSVATSLLNQSINITLSFAQGVLFFLAICMIVFYLLADRELIKKSFIELFPEGMKERAEIVSRNISRKVGGYVIAQILNMIAIGILTAIGLLLIKVDYAILLGLITGILDIIPVIGPTIALILCLLMAYQMGPVGLALVLIIFLTAQWISNNLVRPVVFGKFLDLHPLIIIFALLLGAQFLGVWGVILAPAIAAIVCVLFDETYLKAIRVHDND